MPLPILPVDSARSCSSQAPKSAMPGEAKIVTLSRPWRWQTPMIVPRITPGFSEGGALGAQERTISAVLSKTPWAMPIEVAGTMPKLDSTE
jgi:hypothetical protein